ncbi:hypothetical protein C8R46DRAFT_1084050 [Mycena filopes]|nr:hypothetical protein C8R46DRAFT_1084050 [Mycena filopes]
MRVLDGSTLRTERAAQAMRRSHPRRLGKHMCSMRSLDFPARRPLLQDLAQVGGWCLGAVWDEDGRDGRRPSRGGTFWWFGRHAARGVMAVGRCGVSGWGRGTGCGRRIRCEWMCGEWVKIRATERRYIDWFSGGGHGAGVCYFIDRSGIAFIVHFPNAGKMRGSGE